MKSCLVFACLFYLPGICEMDLPPNCRSRFIYTEISINNISCSTRCSTIPTWDPRYDHFRRHANNLGIVADAGLIIFPENTDQVISIIRSAMADNLRPTVRSGGHCYEDFWSNNTGGVLIDMTAMNRIYRSVNDGLIWVEAGVRMEELYTVLYRGYGLTAPAGSCLDVGIGGLVAVAGYGWMARKYGLITDFVDSMEIVHVTKDRHVREIRVGRKSEDKEKELFWGLQGGGGQNFGIITKIGFRDLPRSPPLVYKYDMKLRLNKGLKKDDFLDFLEKYVGFFVRNSQVESRYCDLTADLIIGRENGEGYLVLRVMVVGEKRELAEEFFRFIDGNETNFGQDANCEAMSYFRFIHSTGVRNSQSDGHYYARRSAYMLGLMPLHQRETIWHFMTDPGFSYVLDGTLQLISYGCAVGRLSENATAYPHRRAVLKVQYGSIWHKAEDGHDQEKWLREFYKGMYGESGPVADDVMDGCYVGYPDSELIDWQHLYFKDNYEKLRQVKKEWDSLNVFWLRQSVELPDE